ncbi:MAG: epoxide hydrolase [Rhodoferax sp.]|uniref:epoxide hydrolase family protein n=1 Tax=Rhodoferax sp. TaxID=50421 RepID=UPI00261580DC|nr:epoxide hydrolase family protein [Rhodoferax sp.]MDD5333883.1 epoxide hydrolase [Rhodoferax sp.]
MQTPISAPASVSVDLFKLAVSDEALSDLRSRLLNTRWPERETVADWSQGVPLERIKALCEYWARDYDWRRCEARLNALGQYRTNIDGLRIHFLHIRSREPNALPLLLTHGWPGSVVEFLDVIGPLTDPAAHGGDGADAFHLVIPSLPGFGFSDKPTGTGWGVERIAAAWISLMKRLGYQRYFAQGGDWGAAVTTAIGMLAPPECAGVHLNMPLIYPDKTDLAELSEAEQASVAAMKFYRSSDSGYAKQQRTRPQTLGYGLTDSPAGQAAWIYEKFYAWTDNRGEPESALSRDAMLDNIMLYWLPATAASSARLYWESLAFFRTQPLALPVGVTIYPKEFSRPSRRWAQRHLADIVHWNETDKGGHFAALEQPQLFVTELRDCFRKIRTGNRS